MLIFLSRVLAATPSPTETADPAATWYSPGVIGFIATFLVTAGAIGLIFDMVRRVRRVRYRAEIQEKLAAEAAKEKPAAAKPAAKTAAKKPAAPKKPERPAAPPKPKR